MPPRDIFFCDGRIGRHPVNRTEMTILKGADDGRDAYTDFQVLKRFKGNRFLVRAFPKTGRTHQIRVHAQYRHHPIASDEKYGDREFNKQMRQAGLKRLFLHARSVEFHLVSTGQQVKVEAPLDTDLTDCLKMLSIGIDSLLASA